MKCFFVSFLFCVVFVCYGVNIIDALKESLSDEVWWGPKHIQKKNDLSVRPFKIEFTDEMIQDLKYRLKNHRLFTPPLESVGFEYGFNSDYLHIWIDYWINDYKFKERENFLNQFPQYKTNIQGLDIHFLWIKPYVTPDVEVMPLLLLHGFPGSVIEFYKTIPLLMSREKDRDFAVELIVPSLPGFGYSEGAFHPGLGATEIGVVIRNLMHRLGFKKFYIQGGDFGAYVGLSIATLYPEETLGYHTNLGLALNLKSLAMWVIGSVYPPLVMNPTLVDRVYPLLDYLTWFVSETGYMHLQATKPDTLGVAMSDSPAGLLAYILQLFSAGSRRANVHRSDGGLNDLYTRDELLDNLMMYWVPNSFTTSARIYAETINIRNVEMIFKKSENSFGGPTTVPTWTIHAKDEIFFQSPMMLKVKYPNLLNSTILEGAGHFLALEEPNIFANDVLMALAAFRKWHEK